MSIPEGYQQIMPYLIVEGVEKFIDFLKKVFGAEVTMSVPRGKEGIIMHAEVHIGQSVIMMADSNDQFKPCTSGMFIYVDDTEKAYAAALAEGAVSLMAPVKTEYASKAAGFRDAWGNTWWPATA